MNRLYFFLAGVASLAILVFLTFSYGRSYEEAKWKEQMAQAELKIKELEAKAPVITERVVTEYVDRIKYIDRIKIETVREYVSVENDAACVINRGFVTAHNVSAAMIEPGPIPPDSSLPSDKQLSQVLQTVIDNYAKYHEVRTQLESLQQWVNEQKQLWNSK